MSLTYGDYLQVDRLLALQTVRSDPPEHDETLFIIIHQVYELWFKQMLHEFDRIADRLGAGDLYACIHTFHRVRTIMKTLVAQLDVLETMTPFSFASFRDRLESSSGFQSGQFREMEFLLGFKRSELLKYYDANDPQYAGMYRREPSVVDQFHRFLATCGVDLPGGLLDRDITLPSEPNEAVQKAVLYLYQTRPEVAILFEQMIDYDEGQQEWRYRHIKVVERTIGRKHGTGGSLGVEFLKRSLFQQVFPDLWAVRQLMQERMRMEATIIDISPMLNGALQVWPGDTPLTREVLCDMAQGGNLTLSTLHATVHLGAHADAPSHYGARARSIEEQDLSLYVGACEVMQVAARRGCRVERGDLPRQPTCARLLLRTDSYPDPTAFNEDFAALAPELIKWLAEQGVRLIGVDTPSVDLFDAKTLIAHHACLERDVAILEGLTLRDVVDGIYELIALPLKLANFDASPVRAVLRVVTPPFTPG